MSSKPKTLICAVLVAACTAGAAVATAAPIPVAVYTFATQGDLDAFSKGFGEKCKKSLVKQQMAVAVGPGTNHCTYRTSVVGDSADVAPDTEIVATATLGTKIPAKLQKKAFVAVGTRMSEASGYEFRVRPSKKNWQLLRDPAGTGSGAAVFKAGKAGFIRALGKPNTLLLRSFDGGSTSTQLIGSVNGKNVFTLTDAGTDQPDGRRSVVSTGAKGSGAGTGITGVFDDVAIAVPNPYE